MKTYEIEFVRHEEVAEGTMAFHFKKPAGFTFKPGQAVDLILIDPNNSTGNDFRHAFSIVSAPYQDEITLATRMRDSLYKRGLSLLSHGSIARMEGPFGSLALHGDAGRPAIFIAGGIGVTPFMSMLRQAGKDLPARDLVLVYSNRRPEDTAFLDELQAIERMNPRFQLIATMTDLSKSNKFWNGHVGVIDAALLSDIFAAEVSPVYYLVGPPGMVEALKETLNGLGIQDDAIRCEEFYGY